MASENGEVCPICLDEFLYPKIIACRHTFCTPCLLSYMRRRDDNTDDNPGMVCCPLCRTNCMLPLGGVKDLVSNYFVRNVRHGSYCETCGNALSGADSQCFHCAEIDKLSEAVGGDDDSDSDTESLDSEALNLSFLSIDRHVRTKFRVSLIGTSDIPLRCEHMLSTLIFTRTATESMITSLCPTANGECYVINNEGPCISKINATGEVTKHICTEPGIDLVGMTQLSDDTLLILVPAATAVIKFAATPEGAVEPIKYASTHPHKGLDMARFPDDRLAVVATKPKKTETEELNVHVLLLFSSHGELTDSRVISGHTGPATVAVSSTDCRIFVTDYREGKVYIFQESGALLETVSRERGRITFDWGTLGFRELQFRPAGVCCDSDGNIFVVDIGSNKIVVMDTAGRSKGVVVTSMFEEIGKPVVVEHGPDGTIWMGDINTGTVRTFEIVRYVNCLDSD